MTTKNELTFDELRTTNIERAKAWEQSGEMPVLFRITELLGELGELANAIKKTERHRANMPGGISADDARENIEEELGDCQICLDLVAASIGVDLGKATIEKFNKTSRKHGFDHRLVASRIATLEQQLAEKDKQLDAVTADIRSMGQFDLIEKYTTPAAKEGEGDE